MRSGGVQSRAEVFQLDTWVGADNKRRTTESISGIFERAAMLFHLCD